MTTTTLTKPAAPAVAPASALGWLAGTTRQHPFTPIRWLAGAPQCRECWGWRDDYRHGSVRHG